ncbi:hypothetical protein [Reinekea sp.]|jgi:hypothetical protein|uniref:hypothetical protein n=1 Tax=Reinekea sp. TaxID=1970455 RepID=UPI003989B84F
MSAIAPFPTLVGSHFIATVIAVQHGQAISLRLANHEVLEVSGHASNTPALASDDQVIAQNIDGQIFVLDRLRLPHERPFLENREGQLSLNGEQKLSLNVSDHSLEVNADGDVVIDAKNISSVASELNEVKGKLITIN